MSQDKEINDDIQLLKEIIDEVVMKYELKVKNLENRVGNSGNSGSGELEALQEENARLKEKVEFLTKQLEASSKDDDYRTPVVKLKKVSVPVKIQPKKTAEASAAVKLEHVVVDDALNPAPIPKEVSITEEPMPEEQIPEEQIPEETPQQASITSTAVSSDSHRKCPSCGNQKKALIHEATDRTHLIVVYPKMYGKKYRCGSCGGEWRIRDNKVEVLK